MKRKKRLAAVVVSVCLPIFLFLTMGMPSINQNRIIKVFLVEGVLKAMQHKNLRLLARVYDPSGLPNAYRNQLQHSILLGWQVKDIDSQPYPMETGSNKVAVGLDLFYQLPADMLQPKGPYQVGDFPPYGKCTKYHAVCHLFYVREQLRFAIDGPDLNTGKDLLVPMPSRDKWDNSP